MSLPVVILAGGLGTRLKKLTEKIPKALIEVGGKPFIFHQLALLKKQNVKDVIISIHHYGDQIRKEIGDGKKFGLSIKYVEDGNEPLGTGGAIKRISKNLKEHFFIMYGDSYLRESFSEILKSFQPNHGPLMVVYHNQDKFDKSNVMIKNNKIYYSKSNIQKNSQYIDYGLNIFHFEDLRKFDEKSFDLSLVQESSSQSGLLQYHIAKERFYEIGTLEGIKDLETFLNENRKI